MVREVRLRRVLEYLGLGLRGGLAEDDDSDSKEVGESGERGGGRHQVGEGRRVLLLFSLGSWFALLHDAVPNELLKKGVDILMR